MIIGGIQIAAAVESQSCEITEIPTRCERALHPGGGHFDNLLSLCKIEVVVVIADQTVGNAARIRDENRLGAARTDLDDLAVNIAYIQVAAAVDRQAKGIRDIVARGHQRLVGAAVQPDDVAVIEICGIKGEICGKPTGLKTGGRVCRRQRVHLCCLRHLWKTI